MLNREEYVEQSHFFKALSERSRQQMPIQDVLSGLCEEALTTTKLPLAIDYMLSEIRHQGAFAPAMARLTHYFTPFQSYLAEAAEDDRGRFDSRLAFEILFLEAKYRADGATPQGIFLFQFETLCRNRLNYDRGLAAVSGDPVFDNSWRSWIMTVRRQMGIVDFADMIYVRSEYHQQQHARRMGTTDNADKAVLFGAKEGKIAWANRRKDPLYLFSALQRQLGYPIVPQPERPDDAMQLMPNVLRRLERIESQLKLIGEEKKQGIDITKFYKKP